MTGPESSSARDGLFATTRWSLVLAAADLRDTEGRTALETLCRTYWFPVYAFIRRRGHTAIDAQDLTQEFFATLLDKRYLGTADPDRGRFRAFLLTMVKNFLSKERDKVHALKRGGGFSPLSIENEGGEQRYQRQPVSEKTAEQIFDRQWALSLLEQSIAGLRQSYLHDGKSNLFEQILPLLVSASQNPSYVEVGARMGMSEGAIKMAVQRLRQRFGELLRQEIAATLNRGDDMNDEINRLLSAVKG